MNAVRCVLATANRSQAYWTYAAHEITFKQSLLVHRTTGESPYAAGNDTDVQLPPLHTFGQFGYTPLLTLKNKLADRITPARYMGMIHINHVVFQLPNGENVKSGE